jgi:cyclophilin family peptidyl-prolyl cis-trans isomerase
MPKTSKREATRRAARIAKAHATQLPPLQVRAPSKSTKAPGYKPPARGITRYPWAIGLSLLVIAAGIFSLYYFQAGPFAKPAPVVKHVTPPDLRLPNPSPCLKLEKQLTDTSPAPSKATINGVVHSYPNAPTMFINTSAFYCVGINTNRGLIVVELDPHYAPVTVNNFVFLAENHFYDGLTFHRVVPGFVIQGGDPTGTGQGGPGYKFSDETVWGKYTQGVIAMANSGANTNGSQFFITLANDTSKLQPKYNLFGRVVAGMNVALKIQGPDPDNGKTNIKPDIMTHVLVLEAYA